MENTCVYAPLVLFVYNRPDHVKMNLRKLNTIRCIENTELFVFSDAAKGEDDKKAVEEVRRFINDFIVNESKFRSIKVFLAETNRGLADSIINGVSSIIHQYGRVIVLEDDLAVADDFIEYMNDALNFYSNKEDIWAISGYTFPMKALEDYPEDIYIACRGCSWGWATWEDRWKTVDWDVCDYKDIKFNIKRRLEFGKWGQDMPFMLDANMYGYNHSWAIRWCYSAYKQNRYTVYPKFSRIVSNGTDGSGTNYQKKITKYNSVLYDGEKKCVFSDVVVNEKIRKEFRRHHMNSLGIIRASIKWGLVKCGILRHKRK